MFDEFNEEFDEFDDEFENDQIDKNNNDSLVYDRTIDYFVRNNYKAIEENGIDIERMRLYSLDETVLEQLKSTIQFMIDYFIELEEYEKCAVLTKYMPEIK